MVWRYGDCTCVLLAIFNVSREHAWNKNIVTGYSSRIHSFTLVSSLAEHVSFNAELHYRLDKISHSQYPGPDELIPNSQTSFFKD
jgi:hypothetical protein